MEHMQKWYESAVASQFVLSVGALNCRDAEGREENAVLLQHESPLDYLLGDAQASLKDRYFLAEFKKDGLKASTEWSKDQRRPLLQALALALRGEDGVDRLETRVVERLARLPRAKKSVANLYHLSWRGHILGYGDWDEGLRVFVTRYAEAIARPVSQWSPTSLSSCLQDLGDPTSPHWGLDRRGFVEYLAHIVNMSESKADSGDDTSIGHLGCRSRFGWALLPFQGLGTLIHLVEANDLVKTALKQLRARRRKHL